MQKIYKIFRKKGGKIKKRLDCVVQSDYAEFNPSLRSREYF